MPAHNRARRTPASSPSIKNVVDGDRETLKESVATPPEPVPETPPIPKTTKPRAGTLEHRLAEALASVSILPSFMGDQYSSFIIASRSAKFAHDLAELAKVNPRVKKILEGMLDGGAMGGVMFSGAAMLLPIIWSYGVLPAPPFDPFGAFYPTVPAGVVPRSATKARTNRSSAPVAGRQTGTTPGPESSAGPGGAPVQPNGDPVGVVTVKPGMVPPMNQAAAAQ